KNDFLRQYEESLKNNDARYQSDPEALKAKVQEAGAQLDEQLVANARQGALDKNPNVGAFREEDPEKAQVREGFMGLIDMAMNFLDSILGELGSILVAIVKVMPGVGSMIHETADCMADATVGNVSAEHRANEGLAAGVTTALQKPIDIGTETFSL